MVKSTQKEAHLSLWKCKSKAHRCNISLIKIAIIRKENIKKRKITSVGEKW